VLEQYTLTFKDLLLRKIMKLIELTINLERQTVFVRCLYNVQGVEHPITFNLKEADLYAAAGVRGEPSWENEDVIAVAQTQLGVSVVEPV
jgi:hypothetical protein